jgi:23S rRNA pseudouridine1911/1915/1917 synthase
VPALSTASRATDEVEDSVFSFEVDESESGRRLDVVLVARVSGMSRARARKLAEEGKIRVNGRSARKGRTLASGEVVSLLELPESPKFRAVPDPSLELAVLYEDAHLVVVDKPPGIASHPLRADEIGTVASFLVARYPEMADVGYAPREPGILHRLDIGTSGALLAAREPSTFDSLRDALRRGHVDKHYLALCRGLVEAPAVIEAPIDADPADRRRVRVHDKGEAPSGARHARTEIVSARLGEKMSLVDARARTGARHQVRAHLAYAGHPLAGDARYGGPVVPGLAHHFLHAHTIAFDHPKTDERISVEAPLPSDRQKVLDALGLSRDDG